MEMYWAETKEGFQAFYACLKMLAKKEWERRYPGGNCNGPDGGRLDSIRISRERAKEKGKRDGRID